MTEDHHLISSQAYLLGQSMGGNEYGKPAWSLFNFHSSEALYNDAFEVYKFFRAPFIHLIKDNDSMYSAMQLRNFVKWEHC